jgi:hypothetical protein
MEVAKFPTAAPFGFLILALSLALAHALARVRWRMKKKWKLYQRQLLIVSQFSSREFYCRYC